MSHNRSEVIRRGNTNLDRFSAAWRRSRRHRRMMPRRRKDALLEKEDGGGDHRGPQSALVTHGRLGDVGGAYDLIGDAINFFFLVPTAIGIKFHVQSCSQHLR